MLGLYHRVIHQIRLSRIKRLIAFWLGLIIFILISNFKHAQLAPAFAQSLRPNSVAEQIYQLIPELPLENKYLSQETKEAAINNTLVSRLIRYHQYVKSRPVKFRLDWQFTMADYLESNEQISYDRYPGSKTLTTHPLEGDRAVVHNLSRSQRNQLIDTLVSIYNPEKTSTNNSTTESNNSSNSNSPRLPQPGDANLLR